MTSTQEKIRLFVFLIGLFTATTTICLPIQAKTINCGWGTWDTSRYNTEGGMEPKEGECPPGPETVTGSTMTAWKRFPPAPSDEAGGARGANRVVELNKYVGVNGYFDEPDISKLVPDKNNKPTFYFGVEGEYAGGYSTAKGKTITDAGVQWETLTGSSRTNNFKGWILYHRVTVSLGDGGSWRLWKHSTTRKSPGNLGRAYLNYHVLSDGKVKLGIIAKNNWMPNLGSLATTLPKRSNGSVNSDAIKIRRVVGLTQAYNGSDRSDFQQKTLGTPKQVSKVFLDGSIVKKLNFSDGSVTQNPDRADAVFHDWPSGKRTNPDNHLERDSAGNIDKIRPTSKAGGHWIIDFVKGPTYPRNAKSGSYRTGYTAENVRIMMGAKTTRVKATPKATPKKPGG